MEPLWLEARLPVLIGNDPMIRFPGTVMVAGTVNPARPVLLRLTTTPLGGAPCVIVTVQVPLAFGPSVVGLHCSDETPIVGPDRVIFALCDTPPYDAVMEPLWLELRLPVLIGNDPMIRFPGTVMVAGTVNPARPVLLRLTTTPLGGAPCVIVTVQVPLAFGPSVVGLHCSDETQIGRASCRERV